MYLPGQIHSILPTTINLRIQRVTIHWEYVAFPYNAVCLLPSKCLPFPPASNGMTFICFRSSSHDGSSCGMNRSCESFLPFHMHQGLSVFRKVFWRYIATAATFAASKPSYPFSIMVSSHISKKREKCIPSSSLFIVGS
jgi:hypothetical protein